MVPAWPGTHSASYSLASTMRTPERSAGQGREFVDARRETPARVLPGLHSVSRSGMDDGVDRNEAESHCFLKLSGYSLPTRVSGVSTPFGRIYDGNPQEPSVAGIMCLDKRAG